MLAHIVTPTALPMSAEFFILSLIVVLAPGPGAVLTVATGLAHGARAAIVTALGCTLGIVPHMLAAISGLAALLHTSALAFELVRYAGAAYLIYMGWATWRAPNALPLPTAETAPAQPVWRFVAKAVLVNLLNPKLSLFFLTFLPQFIAPTETHPAARMGQLSLVFMALTFAVFALYGFFAARMRDHVLQRPAVLQWLRRGFAVAFIGLGSKLALLPR